MALYPLALSELIEHIDNPSLLKEELEQYHTILIENQQFLIPVVVPILNFRFQSIVTSYGQSISYMQQVSSELEELLTQAINVEAKLASLLAIATAKDVGSKIQVTSSNVHKHLNETNTQLKALFLQFTDQNFEESETDFTGLQTNLKKLEDLVNKGLYEDNWLIEQLTEIKEELAAFVNTSFAMEWRHQLATSFKAYRQVCQEIEFLVAYIQKRKRSNPLLSDDLVQVSTELEELILPSLKVFTTVINSVYIYESKIKVVNNNINNYLQLSDKTNLRT